MEPRTSPSQPRALRHPLWWSALALLLLNDHVLKGAGALPDALTGKLSDVAGLLVAPALLAALTGARSRRARALCLTAVALPFVAINLSTRAAASLASGLDALTLPASIWSDPTDLLALAVLPWAWRLTAPDKQRSNAYRRARRFAAVALAGVACLATNQPPDYVPWSGSAYVSNDTEGVITLRLRWADAQLDCDALNADSIGDALDPGVFDHALAITLDPFDTLPISFADAYASIPANPDAMPNNGRDIEGLPTPENNIDGSLCQAVLIQAEGLVDTVAWFPITYHAIPYNLDGVDDADVTAPGAFFEESSANTARLYAKKGLTLVPLVPTLVTTACEERGAPLAFAWSASLPESGTLEGVDAQGDGCSRLRFADGAAGFLCVPEAFVPFTAGDALTLTQDAPGRLALESEPALLTVLTNADASTLEPLGLSVEATTCDGERQACGAFTVPARVRTADGTALRPGDTHTLSDGTQVHVGRAEHVLVAREPCGASRATPGFHVDLLLLESRP